MKIANIDLDSAIGHKILYAMDGLKVRVVAHSGVTAIGVLSVPTVRHPHITLSVKDDSWEPVRIPRDQIAAIELMEENR